jgi:hypothetical protein
MKKQPRINLFTCCLHAGLVLFEALRLTFFPIRDGKLSRQVLRQRPSVDLLIGSRSVLCSTKFNSFVRKHTNIIAKIEKKN